MFKYLCFSLVFTILSISSMDCSLSRLSPQQERELLGKEFYDLLVKYNELESKETANENNVSNCEFESNELTISEAISICHRNLQYIAAHDIW